MKAHRVKRLPIDTGRSGWEAMSRRSLPVRSLDADETARVLRLDAYAGAGVRYAYTQGRVILGVNADVYAQTARHAGPAYAIGADLSIIPQQVRKAPRR